MDTMKANELMIGNLVRVNKNVCIKKDTVVKVKAIDGDNFLREDGLKGCATCEVIGDYFRSTYGVWCEYLAPIPLTHEILTKNGFVLKKTKFETFELYQLLFHTHTDTTSAPSFLEYSLEFGTLFINDGRVPKPVKYVHELQIAYKMCGIEKEVVI